MFGFSAVVHKLPAICKAHRWRVLILMLLASTARTVAAQNNYPGTFADPHSPTGSPDPLKETQIWKVDPITGAVSISIPFLNVRASGRGLFYPYLLQYNSGATFSLSSSIIPPVSPENWSSASGTLGYQNFTWYGPNANGGTGPPAGAPPAPWVEIASPTLYYSESSPSYTIDGSGIGGSGQTESCDIVGPVIILDGKGSHDLNLEPNNSGEPVYGPCGAPSVLTGSTVDGSTLKTNWLGPAYAIYPDGTKFFGDTAPGSSAIAIEDSNGNYLTSSGTGNSGVVSDSLGRPLYNVTENPAVSGQSPAYPASIVTYTTGSSATYTLSWESAPYNFTFPEPTTSDITGSGGAYPPQVTPGPGAGSVYVLHSITLPDTTTYVFTYDPTYGVVRQITFPTGGYVRFVWQIRDVADYNYYTKVGGMSGLAVSDVYVSHPTTSNPTAEDHWVYNCPNLNLTTLQLACSVTNQETNDTITYTGSPYFLNADYLAYSGSPAFQEVLRQVYSDGTLSRTIATSYGGTGGAITLPSTITTTLNDASQGSPNQKQVKYTYDQYSNVIEEDESDFYVCSTGGVCSPPSSSWLTKTFTTYYWTKVPAYNEAHIVDKPYTVTVTDGSGNPLSETQYGYDESALSGGTGIQNHDDTHFPATFVGPRGNMTTQKRCTAFKSGACMAWATTTYTYDLTGQVVSVTDPCGNSTCGDMSGTNHTTTYSYSDGYTDASPTNPTNGFPTTITRPQTGTTSHVDNYTYYFNAGTIATHSDENSKSTTYSYSDCSGGADPFNRIGKVTLPSTWDGPAGASAQGYVSYCYSDVSGAFSVTQNSLMTTSGSEKLTKVTNYDGLGRVENYQITSIPGETIETDTVYDGDNRVYSVSNPYYSILDVTYGNTIYQYDGLDRKTGETEADGVSTQGWTYIGNTVKYLDEDNNEWIRTYDGIGRLTEVLEPGGIAQSQTTASPTLQTNYGYDALGNLLTVSQCGGACPSAATVGRSFSYDALSRLVQAFNPEAGWICYGSTGGAAPNGANCMTGYDANGNLQFKTDARGVVSSFTYDALNRLLSKNFSSDAGTTPSACYQYDSSSFASTGANLIGRLSNEWTQSASAGACGSVPPTTGLWSLRSILAYDAVGRLLSEQQSTPSNIGGTPYAPVYQYDLAGNLYSSTSGIGWSQYHSTNGSNSTPTTGVLTFTRGYDAAGRLQALSSNWTDTMHPATLFSAQVGPSPQPCAGSSAPAYAPFGQLMNAQFGAGLTVNRAFDKRLRITCESDLGGSGSTTPASATITITGTEQTN